MSNSIGWCDMTWNPGIYGCSKVSEACEHCYAMGMAHRLTAMDVYPEGVTSSSSAGPQWTRKVVVEPRPVRLHSLPKRVHKRVFVTSMSDLFHEDVPFAFIHQAFRAMAERPHLTFQVLTKRPHRAVEWWEYVDRMINGPSNALGYRWKTQWPDNVWMGCTVETQERANERIPHLLRLPAPVRFLSCEPLLGPIDLGACHAGGACHAECHVQWVIAGGESGSRARPTDPRWFRSLRDQCAEAGVPFFFKQWGRWVGVEDMRVAAERGLVGHAWYEAREDGGHARWHWPSDGAPGLGGIHPAPSYWVGPKQDPKTLDGVEYRAFPEDR